MCTVSYLPLPHGFIITSNRDEIVSRAAEPPKNYIIHNQKIYFPKDPLANGTWIASSEKFTLCLLNGAFVKHTRKPPYRLSRGLVLLDFFQFNSAEDYAANYNFNGVENFTLLIKSNLYSDFHELRWDGIKVHLKKLDNLSAQIWASCTLYTDEVIMHRRQWFQNWLSVNIEDKQNDIINFHRFAGDGDEKNDVVMKRENNLQTVSITSITKSNEGVRMQYIDIIDNNEYSINM